MHREDMLPSRRVLVIRFRLLSKVCWQLGQPPLDFATRHRRKLKVFAFPKNWTCASKG